MLKSKDKLTELKRLGLIVVAVFGLIILLFSIPSLLGDYARILLFTILLYVTMALSYDVVGGLLGYLYLDMDCSSAWALTPRH
jgi:ABC-type branched-subunit amino acid transport system permease subunit